jgi:hypothetical protein
MLIVVAAAFLGWMFRYELRQDTDGSMVRMNRFTGEVAKLVGAQLVIAQPPRQANHAPTGLHRWDAIHIPSLGDLQIQTSTAWRDGAMLHIQQVTPYGDLVEKAIQDLSSAATLTVMFEDEHGFELASIDFPVRGATRLVDPKTGYSGLERKGSVNMTYETYSTIRSVNVRWSGFPARLARDCVSIRNWDVADGGGHADLLLDLTNSCPEALKLFGKVRLWDSDERPIGERRIPIGTIAAKETRRFTYTFEQDTVGVRFLGIE